MVPKRLSEHHVQLGMLVVWASPKSFGEMIMVTFFLVMVPLRSRNRKIAHVHPWLHVVTLVFFAEEVRRLYIYI